MDQRGSADAEEVVFWHFWGGEDRRVVDEVVDRFNASQSRYHVRAIAMPGNSRNRRANHSPTASRPRHSPPSA